MSNREKLPIDTLRLAPRDRQKLVEAIDRRTQAAADAGRRRSPRVSFNIGSVILLTNPSGNTMKYSVTPRNLSGRGLAFIHGQFMHAATPCNVVLPMRDGQWVRIEGKVIACRHVTGLIHEVSVRFDEIIDLAQFVNLTPEQEIANKEEQAAATSAANGASHQLAGTVLVIDELEVERALLKMWLEKQGLTVVEAGDSDGTKHVLADAAKIDLIVTDIHLGKDDGLNLVKELRTQGFAGPIVAVSSRDDDQTEATALAAGCNAFFPKPCERASFIQTIDQLLSFDQNLEKQPSDQPIRSTLAQDAEMKPLLQRFVSDLVNIVERLQRACQENDGATAAKLCQQLKGAGTSFGFSAISQMARLALGQLQQPKPDAAAVQAAVEALTAVSKRVVAD